MIIDILQTIVDFSTLKNQVNVIQIDKYVYDNLYIHNLDTSNQYVHQKIIEMRYFSRLRILICSNNRFIKNISHLSKTLEKLICNGDWSAINQEHISKLTKLKVLDCSKNKLINNVNHLSETLEDLDCSHGCKIDQYGITNLKKIRTLNCCGNLYIGNVNHLSKTLENLDCSYESAINQNGMHSSLTQEVLGISGLKKIKKMCCKENNKIKNVKEKIFFSLQPSTIIMVSCKSSN